MSSVLSHREYRLLWLGQAISQLGDQFHLIALPWLVLAITGDPLQLGLVLAAGGVPRAILMLFGGALADRWSPRNLMLISNLIRLAITILLVFSVAAGSVQLWMIYAVAIIFGTVSGFFMPAAEATLPRLLETDDLPAGNSLIMIAGQVAQFFGPALAGTLVAWLGGAADGSTSLVGIAAAFGFDAFTFAFSAVTLFLMKPLTSFGSENHPLHDIAEGLNHAWHHTTTRTMILLIALGNFLLTGPLLVGLPVIAKERFAEGAAGFGTVISGYALGNLIGMAYAGAAKPKPRTVGILGTAIFPLLSVIYIVLGYSNSAWFTAALMVVGGMANGYLAIVVVSSLQQMTPPKMIGRVMSLFMLSIFGLTPLSQVITGAILPISSTGLFIGVAILLLIPGLLAFLNRGMWDFTPYVDKESQSATTEQGSPIAPAND